MQKILIVDDEEEIIELVSFILKREGYSVLEASSMTLAMNIIHREIPDLIILDLMLASHEDGFEMCRALKCDDRYKNIPIVILSAIAFSEYELVRKIMDIQDYIIKPFNNDDFVNRIKNVLKERT